MIIVNNVIEAFPPMRRDAVRVRCGSFCGSTLLVNFSHFSRSVTGCQVLLAHGCPMALIRGFPLAALSLSHDLASVFTPAEYLSCQGFQKFAQRFIAYMHMTEKCTTGYIKNRYLFNCSPKFICRKRKRETVMHAKHPYCVM